MKSPFSCFLVCVVAAALFIPHASAQVIEIPDPNLERAIREALTLPDETPITQIEMLRLKRFTAREAQIADLTGLEYATHLKSLVLSTNEIRDITPLAELINLDFLILHNNPIADLSPLTNLTQLTYLGLIGVSIKALTPLANLTQLNELYLNHCEIRDITSLSNLTQLSVLRIAANRIIDISPLANLTALEKLSIESNQIVNISPLANLTRLKELRIDNNRIVDINPLANLTQLEKLYLNHNRIMDISPLANLTRLEVLRLHYNQISDYSPLDGLSLTHLEYDEFCELPGLPIKSRIANRSFPSIFQPWSNEITDRPDLSPEDRLALHDLHWRGRLFGLHFQETTSGYRLVGDIEKSIAERDALLARNPNMLFLIEIRQRDAIVDLHYPEDWPYWLRDEAGNPVLAWERWGIKSYLMDFTQPGAQDIIVQQALAVAKCGLFDGIFFDSWSEDWISLQTADWSNPYSTPEVERQARLSIVQRIRANIPDDFLMIANMSRSKMQVTGPYFNGSFMEAFRDYDGGYTHDGLAQMEDTLLWLEENLREPRVNLLEGWGVGAQPPDSPTNKRWMRTITTLGLTHSDGYVLYNMGGIQFTSAGNHAHIYHDFWTVNLGRPVGTKAQRYQNVEGLFIREFTNGWAVYNRSGQAQTITLPSAATAVGNGDLRSQTTHLLPDLDGEIYLKSRSIVDVNRDGKVNVLDLVQVANGLGKAAPDPNGDGVVNILDLVFVANNFSQ